MSKMIHVTMSALTEVPEEATRAAEVFGRAAMGLALEDIYVNLSFSTSVEEEDGSTDGG